MGHTELKTSQNVCAVLAVLARCARWIEFYSDCKWHRSSFTAVHTFRQDTQDAKIKQQILNIKFKKIKRQKLNIKY